MWGSAVLLFRYGVPFELPDKDGYVTLAGKTGYAPKIAARAKHLKIYGYLALAVFSASAIIQIVVSIYTL